MMNHPFRLLQAAIVVAFLPLAAEATGLANLVNNGDFEVLELDEFDTPLVNAYGDNTPSGWFFKTTTPAQTATPAVQLIGDDDADGDGVHSYALNYYEVSVGGFSFPGEADIRSQAIEVIAGEELTWSFSYKLLGVDQGLGDEFRADFRFFEDLSPTDTSSTGSAFIFEDVFYSSAAVVPEGEWQTITREFTVPYDSPESPDDNNRPAAGTTVYADLRFSINAFTSFGGGQVLFDSATVTRPVSADYNGDGLVDAADYTVWRDTQGSETDFSADGTGDGVVDDADYNRWVIEYGSTVALSNSLAIPEPGSLVTTTLAILLVRFSADPRRHA
jgi:hypothetical protein